MKVETTGEHAMDVVAALTKVAQQQATIREQETLLQKLSDRVKKLEKQD